MKASAILTIAATALLGLSASAVAQTVGDVARVQNFAYGEPPAGARAPIYTGDAVVRNHKLETVDDAAMRVTFQDGTELTLGASATVTIDEFVYASGGDDALGLAFANGAMRFVSGQIAKDAITIRTPVATVGVRGTTLLIEVMELGSVLTSVVEGAATVNPANGDPVNVAAGQSLLVTADGDAGAPTGFVQTTSQVVNTGVIAANGAPGQGGADNNQNDDDSSGL